MDMIRRHLFLILCGVGALVGIALMVTGLRAMPAVQAEMGAAVSLYEKLNSLQQKSANQQVLDAHQRRIDQIIADRDAVVAKVKELCKYPPLVPEALPDGNADARRQFRRVYGEEMRKLYEALRPGRPALDSEINAMKEKIEDETLRRARIGAAVPADEVGPDITVAGVVTKGGARKDPAVRAHLAAAQRCYCYAVDFRDSKPGEAEPSLFFEPAMKDTGAGDAPELDAVWRAQLGYWIQKDVVEAITALNDEAAAAARDRGEDRWVGNMPVKEVISIRVSKGYVQNNEDDYRGDEPGGYKAAVPPAAMKTAFTKSASGEFYEILQFTVKLIMDQRDVLRFVERLCDGKLHTPLRIAYKSVEPNRGLKGKIYGSQPVVNVIIDLESLMPGEVFRPLMPESVCADQGVPCAKGQEKPAKRDG